MMRVSPALTARIAGSARGFARTNHWMLSAGSATVRHRAQWPTVWGCGSRLPPGPELPVDHFVGKEGDGPVHERKTQRRPDAAGKPLIRGVHGNGGVAQHRFGTGG